MIFVLNFVLGENPLTFNSFRLLLPILGETCWYFSAYMLLMVISPFINKGIDSTDLRSLGILVIFIFVVIYVGGFLFHRNGTTFMLLLTIYIIARFIKKSGFEIKTRKAFLLFISFSSVEAISVGVAAYFGEENLVARLCNNHNPLLLLSAISVFFMFKNLPCNNNRTLHIIQSIAPYTFAVYVIHVNAMSVFDIVIHTNYIDYHLLTVIIAIFVLILLSGLEYLRVRTTYNLEDFLWKQITLAKEKYLNKIL